MNEENRLKMWDSFDEILKAGEIDAIGFDFSIHPDGRSMVTQAIESMANLLENQDTQWEGLFRNNQENMSLWRNRLYVIVLAMQTAAVAVADRKHELDWGNIARNLGLINAFRTAAEQAIAVYGAKQKGADAIDCA